MASGHEVRLLTTAVAQRHPAFEVLQEALSDQVQVSVMPEVKDHLATFGMYTTSLGPAKTAAFVKSELERNGSLVGALARQ